MKVNDKGSLAKLDISGLHFPALAAKSSGLHFHAVTLERSSLAAEAANGVASSTRYAGLAQQGSSCCSDL